MIGYGGKYSYGTGAYLLENWINFSFIIYYFFLSYEIEKQMHHNDELKCVRIGPKQWTSWFGHDNV